jgi:hypothetical protein
VRKVVKEAGLYDLDDDDLKGDISNLLLSCRICLAKDGEMRKPRRH